MLEIESVKSPSVKPFELNGKPVPGSAAVRVQGEFALLMTSGQVAPKGAAGRGPIEMQVRAVLEQIRELVVEAGGEMHHIIKLMAWVPRREDVATYAEIRRDYFPDSSPASTSVICELVESDIAIEVEAIAAIPIGV